MYSALSNADRANLARWMIQTFIKSKMILIEDAEILESFRFPIVGNASPIGNTMLAGGVASVLGIFCAARYNSYIGLGASVMPIFGNYAYRGYSMYRMNNIKNCTCKLINTLQKTFLLNLNVQNYSHHRQNKLKMMKSADVKEIVENCDVKFYKIYKQNLLLIVTNMQEALQEITKDIPSLAFYYRTVSDYNIEMIEFSITAEEFLEEIKTLHDLYCLVSSAFLTCAGIAIKIFCVDVTIYKYVEEIVPKIRKTLELIHEKSEQEYYQFRAVSTINVYYEAVNDTNKWAEPLKSLGMHCKLVSDISSALLMCNDEETVSDSVNVLRNELTSATESLNDLVGVVGRKRQVQTRPASTDTESSFMTAVAQSDETEEETEPNTFEATGEFESFYTIEEEPTSSIEEDTNIKRTRIAVVRELKEKLQMINAARGITSEQPPPPPLPSDILTLNIPSDIRIANSNNSISLSEAVSAIARHMNRTEDTFGDEN
ncbi:PREDICTED: uncharacterized protein LOC108567743 [Nicrophorus vespilloides]|uniref:Uncharacterized protein LOC108567743 n=1 Tax=Nicrophorus vespilloides TaxID=110193 RepID=A0ABM1NAM1_NICVS|nr:PREDICTED: uncharacterized protein LOC108567743 [Nicrophorus vespilloides]XP_017783871.1 PREDICTED: uncharacterized protein LOC108567743 [Nicrophorus vespilloides]XP_017783872.1 PREDICTED: uncharacterized protein LOC108567743 [Nicrophorus vespilloides]